MSNVLADDLAVGENYLVTCRVAGFDSTPMTLVAVDRTPEKFGTGALGLQFRRSDDSLTWVSGGYATFAPASRPPLARTALLCLDAHIHPLPPRSRSRCLSPTARCPLPARF